MQSERTLLLCRHLVQPLPKLGEICEALLSVELELQTVPMLIHEGPRAALLCVAIRANPLAFGRCGEPPWRDLISLNLEEARVDVPQECDISTLCGCCGRAFEAAPHRRNGFIERRNTFCGVCTAISERRLFVDGVDLRLWLSDDDDRGNTRIERAEVSVSTGVDC